MKAYELEGQALAELAAGVPAFASIVEIGSYMGRSTCYLASQAQARVFAVDLWDMRLPGEEGRRNKHEYAVRFDSAEAFEAFKTNLRAAGVESRVTWIKGDSREIAKAWSRPIGLLFIDGAHDGASVRADYEGWSPHVLTNGWIAFHDAQDGGKVAKVIDTVVKPSGLWGEWRTVERMAVARRLAWPNT